ncbi:CPBP family intramembrane metalloprotease [Candidatus Gracilibacteria bacterium]|nr:CPBP family intramembrane metalloprotease [Candidatus Gracilibacteria bacterium]
MIQNFVNFLKKFPPGIFMFLILLSGILWSTIWGNIFWGNVYIEQNDALLLEIWKQPFIALGEELLFRFMPFTIVTLIWILLSRIKIMPNFVLIIMVIIPIVYVQILFGLEHVLWDSDIRIIIGLSPKPELIEQLQHVVLQGGMGILLSFAYLKFLLNSRKIFKYVQIIPLIMCIILHTLNNQILMIINSWN